MRIPEFAVSKSVTTSMIFIGILVIGAVSLPQVAIDLLPDISFPSVTVSTIYDGASPKEVETLITEPVERAVSTVQDVKRVTSSSNENNSSVRVEFEWGKNMEEAANDVREKVAQIQGLLPEDSQDPLIFKFDTSNWPIMTIGLTADEAVMSLDKLRDYADDEIKYKFEQIEGVAAVGISGGLEREIQVNINKSQLEGIGLSIGQLNATLRSENLDLPGGYVETGRNEFLIRTKGEFSSVSQIENVVIAHRDGVPVYLKDIATLNDSFKEVRNVVRVDGRPAVMLRIQKQSGKNTVKVADQVKKRIAKLENEISQGMELTIIQDSSKFIRDSISQLSQAAIIGGILAVLILFVFLRSIKSIFIISVSIPLSIVATFILMHLAHLSLNIMSLGGLALGIGMLVDNSIVVLESIFRHRESGEGRIEAAINGSKEVGAAITASTLTTLCVFVPLLLVGRGIQAIFFKQLAYTVSFSLASSLFVALSLTPMLASKLLVGRALNTSDSEPSGSFMEKPGKREEHGQEASGFSSSRGVIIKLENKYKNLLGWALRHQPTVIFGSILLLFISFAAAFVWPKISFERVPQVDEGQMGIGLELPIGTRLEVTDQAVQQIEKMIESNVPEMKAMYSSIGSGGDWFARSSGSHGAGMFIQLVDKQKRKRSLDEVTADMRKKLTIIPDARVWLYPRGNVMSFVLSGGRQDRLEVEIRGYDLDASAQLANEVVKIMEEVPGVVTPRSSRPEGKPELLTLVDRDKASVIGLNMSAIASTIRTNITGTVPTRYREAGDEIDVRVRLREEDRSSLEDIGRIFVTTSSQGQVPLKNIAQIRPGTGPIRIERKGQDRYIVVSAGLDKGFAIGDVAKAANEKLLPLKGRAQEMGLDIRLAGELEEAGEESQSLLLVLLLAIALIYMVMASQYEALLHPFVIMFTIPFSSIGVIWALILSRTHFSMVVLIGAITLAGIVVNNAIVLIDYINLLRRKGLGLYEAVQEAGRIRLRPILMTTLTTVLALVPMALGIGSGSEMQAPMARTIFGGLTVAAMFTLIFIPVLYCVFERVKGWMMSKVAPT